MSIHPLSQRLTGIAALILAAVVWLPKPAPAATNWWDGGAVDIGTDGNGASAGGAGTWSTAISNWDTGAAPHTVWINGDFAIFGGTAGIVQLGTPITAGGLRFDTTGYTISNNTLTLTGDAIINVATGTSEIKSVIAGTVGLTKSGSGTLTLSGLNTFTSNTVISAGMLQIGNNNGAGTLGGASYTGNISIASSAKLFFNSSTSQILSGIISGDGTLQKGGSGTLTLGTNNTYTGKTIINTTGAGGPTLSVGSFNSVNGGTPLMASSSLGAPTTVANGTIDLGSGGNVRNCTLIYTGPGETTDRIINISFNSGAKQTLNASGTGLLKFTSSFTINPSSGTTGGGLILRGTGEGEIVGSIGTGIPGSLEKADSGTWTIGGTNNPAAGINITGGTLVLQRLVSLLNNTQSNWTTNRISVANGTTLALGVGDSAAGYFDATALDTLRDGTHLGLSTATVGFRTGGIFGFDTTNATAGVFTYNSNIGNLGTSLTNGLAKLGLGTLVLGGANTYTGPTTVRAGTLVYNGTLAAGPGSLTVASGGTLGGTGTISRLVSIANGGTLAPGNSPGLLTVSSLNLASNATFAVELGLIYDQVLVTGSSVSVSNANLALTWSITPTAGASFLVISNDTPNAVFGEFSDWANLTTQTVSGVEFEINYAGGSGNDVVLTVVPEPASLVLVAAGLAMLWALRRRR